MPERPFDDFEADDAFRAWLSKQGIEPADPAAVLRDAGHITPDFARWVHRALVRAHGELHPETRAIELVPGERVGIVPLGAPRSIVDALLGEPDVPSWAADDATETAFHRGSPYVIRTRRRDARIVEVTIHAGPFDVVWSGAPLLAEGESDAIARIRAADPEVVPSGRGRRELCSNRLGVALTIAAPLASDLPGWVAAVRTFVPAKSRAKRRSAR